MKLKYYLKGIGVGIIFATFVLAISFAFNGDKMSEQEIVEAAMELGMVWPSSQKDDETTSAPTESETTTEKETTTTPTESETPTEETTTMPTESETTTEEEETTTTPTESETTTEEETTTTPTESETTTEEETTTTPTESKTTTGEETTTKSTESETTTGEETTTTPIEPESTTEKETTSMNSNESVTIRVLKGMSSDEVAKLLLDAGVIEDDRAFDRYIIRKGYAERIRIGTFQIKINATYDEIIRIICGLN